MTIPARVVWSEGMHLSQHHFQAQSRWFEGLAAFTLRQLFFAPYGVAGVEMDGEALLNGTVVLRHARGIMPDGLPFRFPDDPPPDPLDIRELFSPVQESHRVLLTLPRELPGRALVADASANGARAGARWLAETRPVADETAGGDEQPVTVGRKNFRLELETGDAAPDGGERVALPIARVRRDGAGHFVYDAGYVPPCLQIGASERLLELAARLTEMLDAKAGALRAGSAGVAAAGPDEAAGLWLAHALHSSRAPLEHLRQARGAHPEQLFAELSRLAGALCTFSLTSDPRTLPLYDHDALDASFGALERHILDHLEIVIPTRGVRVPLERTAEWYHAGKVADRRCFERAHWYLGVRSPASAAVVIGEVPKRVKVCSAKHIERLVREAFPGLPLEHEGAPPGAISPRPGTHYFRIRPQGPCWASIAESGEIGVYAPAAIPDAELELAIVTEA
ncbi:MAG TPA: type VI secretion system baseplate subunit TssK [Longimicrobium sp.]